MAELTRSEAPTKAGELIQLFPTDDMSDRELVRRLAYGREQADAAVRILYTRHYMEVAWLACAQLAGDRAAADEVAQETFATLYEDAPRPRAEPGYLRAWLLRAAYLRCKDRLKRARVRNEVAPGDGLGLAVADHREGPEEALRWKEARATLHELIEAFPPAWKAVYRLRVERRLGFAEIAAIVDLSVGTVKKHFKDVVDRMERLAAQLEVTRDR